MPSLRHPNRCSPRATLLMDALEPRRLLDGLTGQYFNSLDFTEPALTRTDPTIDFTWSGAPASGVNADFFSARWIGQVQAASTELYTFTTSADDGVRLWVDGRLLIDNWQNQGTTERSASLPLEAGKRYDIRLDYYEYNFGARLRLAWSTPTIADQTVPATSLFSATSGLSATYYNGLDFTGPGVSRVDANVDFTWPAGTPDASIAADGFSARWTGYIVPQFTETYAFALTTGETTNVKLRIDEKLVVDPNSPQDDGRILMEAGKRYPIVVEMADIAGPANVMLTWQSPSQPLQTVPTSRLFAGQQTTVPSRRVTYTNPVIDADMPDPGIIFADGYYWMVHTMGGPDVGWPLWKSADMVNWTFVKHLLTTSTKRSWMSGDFWAPEIHKVGSTFVITGTSRDSRTGRLSIAMGSSDRIDGTYTLRTEPLVSDSVHVLDSDIFQNDDGRQYLLWKRDGPTDGTHGTIRIRELDSTGLNFKSGSTETVILDNETGGWERNLAEGPWLVRRSDAYYLFYSGGFIDTTYSLGVARSTSLTTMFTRNPSNPIITNNTTWGGPGHGGFAMDRDGTLWHLYHARLLANTGAGRKQVLDPVIWNSSGWPMFAGTGVSTFAKPGPHVDAPSGAGVLTFNGDLTSAGQADTFRLVRGSNASTLEVWLNGVVAKSVPFLEVQQISIDAKAGDDVLILDESHGTVIPGAGLTFEGGAGNDTVRIIAEMPASALRLFASRRLASGTGGLATSNIEALAVNGGAARATADLSGLAIDLTDGTTWFDVSQHLAALKLSSAAQLSLGTGSRVLGTTSVQLADTARIDLNDGSMVVDYASGSPIAAITSALRTGYAAGTWAGPNGIVSTTAATAGNALGVAEASSLGSTVLAAFPGYISDNSAVVVRYTRSGDADLNRTTNFADLLTLAAHYAATNATYADGDFNYDGTVNFADLLILASSYGTTLPSATTASASAIRTAPSRDDRIAGNVLA
ncbi:MAG: family 43 glycosylhydrolase [Tepidisphaeraceae bacterium]